MNAYKYSWILPVKNEALSLPQLIEEIKTVMKGKQFEIIAVNDASIDDTLKVLRILQKQIPQLKVIDYISHQGKWAALANGFKKAKGEIIITSDSDLQDDPGEVLKLLSGLDKGYDLVSGWRKVRLDPTYKVIISKLGNLLASGLSAGRFRDLNSPFKVYRRQVFDNLPKQGSLIRFSMLFAYKLGYKVMEVPIRHRQRLFGKSKFGIIKYLRIVYDLLLVLLLFSGSGKLRRKNS